MFFPVWFFLFSNRINYWKAKKKNQGHFSSSLSIVWAVINPENGKLNFMFFCMWNNSESPIKKSYSLIIILEPKKKNINFQPKIFKLFFWAKFFFWKSTVKDDFLFIYHWCFEKQESFLCCCFVFIVHYMQKNWKGIFIMEKKKKKNEWKECLFNLASEKIFLCQMYVHYT